MKASQSSEKKTSTSLQEKSTDSSAVKKPKNSYSIEVIPIDQLIEDKDNARKHTDKNISTIVASLQRFGQQKPIVIDQHNVVRAGNGSLQAAKKLGWQTIACYRSELTGAELKAYAVADNRTAELAEWDDEILRSTLESIRLEDEALLEAAGYTEDLLSQMIVNAMADAEILVNDEQVVAKDDSISISFPVTADEEALFRKAVSQAKKTFSVNATGTAVFKIMEQWIGQVQ